MGLNNIGKGIAAAMSHPIGVGNAKHRFPNYEGYAEMACFPMFRRDIFNEIGLYDETLIKNQDDEFCFRLRRGGKLIYISPIVKSIYVVRSSFSSLFNQYFFYGYYRISVIRKHKIPISYRQFIPPLFFTSLIILIISSIFLGEIWIGLSLPIFYVIIVLLTALLSKKVAIKILLFFIIGIFILHLSYAAGFLRAMSEVIIPKSSPLKK
jgi:GT2 family glycosyltransferase